MKPKLELDQAKGMTWGEVNEVKDTCQSCQGSGVGINADCKCAECGGSGESWRPISPTEIELYEYYIKTKSMNPTDEEIEKFANLMVADHDFDNLPKEAAVKRASIQTAKWARDLKRPWMTEVSDILYDAGFSAEQKVVEMQKILEYHFG